MAARGWRLGLPLGVALAVAACGGPDEPLDAATDAGGDAAGDAGTRLDATTHGGLDAQSGDAGPSEAGEGGMSDAGGGEPFAVRLLALNLHCLEHADTPYPSNEARLAAVARLVATERVDVLALQEVCTGMTEDALAMLTQALERETAESWHTARAFAHVAWEGTARQADEDLAILSRLPIVAERSLEHRAQGALRRVSLFATLANGLTVATVHLDHRDAAAREEQARELAAAGLVLADPSLDAGWLDIVLAGDFNARAPAAPLAAVRALDYVDATATLPSHRIDHVYVHSSGRFVPGEARFVLDGAADRVSDHPGILLALAERTPLAQRITRVVARVDVGPGSHLFVRGDGAPLTWERGWPMTNTGPDEWRFTLTPREGALRFKTLIDDVRWQRGEDSSVEAGSTIELVPSYE